jgi:hypothetical protein
VQALDMLKAKKNLDMLVMACDSPGLNCYSKTRDTPHAVQLDVQYNSNLVRDYITHLAIKKEHLPPPSEEFHEVFDLLRKFAPSVLEDATKAFPKLDIVSALTNDPKHVNPTFWLKIHRLSFHHFLKVLALGPIPFKFDSIYLRGIPPWSPSFASIASGSAAPSFPCDVNCHSPGDAIKLLTSNLISMIEARPHFPVRILHAAACNSVYAPFSRCTECSSQGSCTSSKCNNPPMRLLLSFNYAVDVQTLKAFQLELADPAISLTLGHRMDPSYPSCYLRCLIPPGPSTAEAADAVHKLAQRTFGDQFLSSLPYSRTDPLCRFCRNAGHQHAECMDRPHKLGEKTFDFSVYNFAAYESITADVDFDILDSLSDDEKAEPPPPASSSTRANNPPKSNQDLEAAQNALGDPLPSSAEQKGDEDEAIPVTPCQDEEEEQAISPTPPREVQDLHDDLLASPTPLPQHAAATPPPSTRESQEDTFSVGQDDTPPIRDEFVVVTNRRSARSSKSEASETGTTRHQKSNSQIPPTSHAPKSARRGRPPPTVRRN